MCLGISVYVQGSLGHENGLQDGQLVPVQELQVQAVQRVLKHQVLFLAVGDWITDKYGTHM